MIDIEIQISISERSSGWAINYLVGGKEENRPAGDVGDGGENEHPPRADQLLKEAAKHRNDDLGVVFRGAWCNN